MTQTHTDHVGAATAKRLHDLGAFADRELRVGDWVICDAPLGGTEPWYIHHINQIGDGPKLLALERANGDFSALNPPDSCTLLPRLADLLDEITRVDGTPPFLGWNGDLPHPFTCGTQNEEFYPEADSYLDAVANCLIAVLEVRKEGEGR